MRQDQRQAGVLEIDVTPAMIEAGMEVAALHDVIRAESYVLTELFLAMLGAAPPARFCQPK